MRGGSLDLGTFSRALGLIAVALILVLAIIHVRRQGTTAWPSLVAPAAPNDALAQELARCQAIGIAAIDDAGCKSAWAENRRRFFILPSADAAPTLHATESNPAATPRGR
jgi:conjugative transfer region protein TrbK